MFPPPMTMATCTPRACTSLTCSAMARMTSNSRPNGLDPMRASPESLRRTLRYRGSLTTRPAPSEEGSLSRRVIRSLPVVLAEHEPGEPLDPDVLAGLGDDVVDDVLHGQVRIAHERLLHEAEFLVELLHPAGDDLLHHGRRLPRRGGLLPVDLPFLIEHVLGHLLAVHDARLGGGDVHCQVLHERLEVGRAGHEVGLAVHLDQDPNPPARVDVRADRPLAGRLRGALHGGRLSLLAEDPVGLLQITFRLDQGGLAVPHRRSALVAELLDQGRADGHSLLLDPYRPLSARSAPGCSRPGVIASGSSFGWAGVFWVRLRSSRWWRGRPERRRCAPPILRPSRYRPPVRRSPRTRPRPPAARFGDRRSCDAAPSGGCRRPTGDAAVFRATPRRAPACRPRPRPLRPRPPGPLRIPAPPPASRRRCGRPGWRRRRGTRTA